MWFFSVVFLSWNMTREFPVNRFHSKSCYVLCDIIIYHITFLWFLFNMVFLTTVFPSQLDLLILQTSLLSSLPPILVDTISMDVTRIKTYFWRFTLGFIFFKECDHHKLSVMRPIYPTLHCVSGNVYKQTYLEIPEVTYTGRLWYGLSAWGWNYG
jgi:hypothetical protein